MTSDPSDHGVWTSVPGTPGTEVHTVGGGPIAHRSITLIEPACTSCMICARECPSWCITIDSHTEPVPDLPAGARERTRNVLDRFAIDWSLCMYCGICVTECPFDALEWSVDLVPAGQDLRALIQEKDDLTSTRP